MPFHWNFARLSLDITSSIPLLFVGAFRRASLLRHGLTPRYHLDDFTRYAFLLFYHSPLLFWLPPGVPATYGFKMV